MPERTPQRRGRRIAMTDAEVDAFLAEERTCRVATVSDGRPHVTPLWFVWHDGCVWVSSITDSKRWAGIQRDPHVAIVVDAGTDYLELRGVEISGTAEVVGEVPRGTGDFPELVEPERLMGAKYRGGGTAGPDGRHAWLRVTPDSLVSWDFRKLAAL